MERQVPWRCVCRSTSHALRGRHSLETQVTCDDNTMFSMSSYALPFLLPLSDMPHPNWPLYRRSKDALNPRSLESQLCTHDPISPPTLPRLSCNSHPLLASPLQPSLLRSSSTVIEPLILSSIPFAIADISPASSLSQVSSLPKLEVSCHAVQTPSASKGSDVLGVVAFQASPDQPETCHRPPP